MNGAQIHLLLNHLPVILPAIGGVLLASGFWLQSLHLKNAGLLLLIVGALFAIPTYLTGDLAEQVAKNYPGVNRGLIHEHEEAGEYALIAISVTGALALLLLVIENWKKRVPKPFWATLLVLCLFSFVIMVRTAHLGGLIRHEEIRPGTFSQTIN